MFQLFVSHWILNGLEIRTRFLFLSGAGLPPQQFRNNPAGGMSSISFQQGNRRKGKSNSRQEEQQQQQKEEEEERVFSLSEADIEYIYDRTHYSVKDIKDWHRGFARDCPSGRLCRQRVTEVYDELFPHGSNNKWLVDTIFRIFDQDDNGYLDFKS